MRGLTTEELGHVYGAGNYYCRPKKYNCKKSSGSKSKSKSKSKSRSKSKSKSRSKCS